MARINGNKKLKAASFFCGCGGMDLGLVGGFSYLNKNYSSLPFEVVYANDFDKYATEIYNNNFDHQCVTKDIKDVNV
ncbi:MAG: DNA cytosine methyltransferase [Marinicella sp.]